MPTSDSRVIPAMIQYMRETNARSILDVGSGCGKWGVLAREYMEVWQGRTYPDQWIIRIDAVDIWPPYAAYPAYDRHYNHLYITDIVDFVKDMEGYDLIICGDVLEHLEKSMAWSVLRQLLKHCRYMVVSIPMGLWPTLNVGDNAHENHISTWDDSDIALLPIVKSQFVASGSGRIFVALLREEIAND